MRSVVLALALTLVGCRTRLLDAPQDAGAVAPSDLPVASVADLSTANLPDLAFTRDIAPPANALPDFATGPDLDVPQWKAIPTSTTDDFQRIAGRSADELYRRRGVELA
jgi:hypothetical protein